MAAENREPDLESFRKLYCPPLDEALFYAIALDYDLEDGNQITQLEAALESLKEVAVEEQEPELLPSITTIEHHSHESDPKHDKDASKGAAAIALRCDPQSTTDDDAGTSFTTGFSSLGVSDVTSQDNDTSLSGYGEAGEAFDSLDQDEKAHWLMSMFPAVKKADIETILVKCNGNFDRSTDELLNETFFQDHGVQPETQKFSVTKGIDGFLIEKEEDTMKKKGRGRNRRARNRDALDPSSGYHSDSARFSGISTPNSNVWKSGPDDIKFITARTELKTKPVTSLYHANGAKLAPTVRAILIKETSSHPRDANQWEEVVQWQVDELKAYFDNVPDDLIHAALMLTRRSPSAAKELLDVMIASTEQPTVLGKVQGLASYAPLNLADEEPTTKRDRSAPAWSTNTTSNGYTVNHMANAHGVAAANAFHQASAAYKRGKSDRLMGGAAAYYASVGHDHVNAAKATQAYEADAHVAQQSSSTTLDLHGVNVAHAVRIAQEATQSWWDGLGDRKYAPVGGVGSGYKIVTGVGRHSADGVGRIGPAVSRMLVREGWKVEVGSGEIIVWGRARKK